MKDIHIICGIWKKNCSILRRHKFSSWIGHCGRKKHKVRVYTDNPTTGKPTEARMRRGKGNPTGWIAHPSRGQNLFEMDGVSSSNARQAAALAVHKLCLSTKFVQGNFIRVEKTDIIWYSSV